VKQLYLQRRQQPTPSTMSPPIPTASRPPPPAPSWSPGSSVGCKRRCSDDYFPL